MTIPMRHAAGWHATAVDLPFLDEREQKVLGLRLGLDGGAPRSRLTVARLAHLDAAVVRRVEAVAVCKLHHPSASSFEPQVSELLAALARLP